jgi:ubiquinone/menaquinone biosynthesis C-methylase UbiE
MPIARPPSWWALLWRGAALTALSATTASAARWLRDSLDARARVRVPGRPAAIEPPAARAQQRQADTPPWRLVEGRLARRALAPFRVRPTFRPLRALNLDHGPGGVALALANAAPQDSLVVATDAQAGMAELARERAGRRGQGGGEGAKRGGRLTGRRAGPDGRGGRGAAGPGATVAFVRARPERLPFRDGAFDLALSAGGLHQWRDPEGTMREVRRTLAQEHEEGAGGGRYLIADVRRDVTLAVWFLLRLGQSLFAPRALQALDEPSASYRAGYAPQEAEWLAARGRLPDLNVVRGAAWIMIERGAVSPPRNA